MKTVIRDNVGEICSIRFLDIIEHKNLWYNKYLISFIEFEGYYVILRHIKLNELKIGSIITFNLDGNMIRPYNVVKL